jgi:HSP20 family protein
MAKDNRSFLERLTGSVRLEENPEHEVGPASVKSNQMWDESVPEEGELSVDVYQNPTDIIVKTMVAGVKPEDLDVSISREIVTIKGKREEERTVSEGDYFHKELYWGSFSRTVVLPQEIDVDAAEASEKHGLLILRLPKLNKNRQTKIRVRGS